jgi:hypothetical protein
MTELRVRYKGKESLLIYDERKRWVSLKVDRENQDTFGLSLDYAEIKKGSHSFSLEIGHFLVVLNLDAYGSREFAENALRTFKNAVGLYETAETPRLVNVIAEEQYRMRPTSDQMNTPPRQAAISNTSHSATRGNPNGQNSINGGNFFRKSYGSTLIKLFWYLSLIGIVPSTIFYSSVLFKAKLPYQAWSVIWAGLVMTAIIRLVCEWLSNHFQQTALLKQIVDRL